MGITPGSAEQRFPGYDVMGQSPAWDEVTRAVVIDRCALPDAPAFFTAEEEPTARALLDRLLAQDDDPRVPVFEAVDQRLAERRGDGYRYEGLPEDPETWRGSLAALDATAQAYSGNSFANLSRDDRARDHRRGPALQGRMARPPASRLFSVWMRYACSAFYAHPWVWNEIGFGGPAYPRGYKYLALGAREPWEVAERDAEDPVPWVQRSEAAQQRHASGLSSPDAARQGPAGE